MDVTCLRGRDAIASEALYRLVQARFNVNIQYSTSNPNEIVFCGLTSDQMTIVNQIALQNGFMVSK